jgi:glutamate synthase (NADPH/NADH) large chain
MGDMLRRCRTSAHSARTSQAPQRQQARADLLEDWDNALTKFVKVMPRDYAKALQQKPSVSPPKPCAE